MDVYAKANEHFSKVKVQNRGPPLERGFISFVRYAYICALIIISIDFTLLSLTLTHCVLQITFFLVGVKSTKDLVLVLFVVWHKQVGDIGTHSD